MNKNSHAGLLRESFAKGLKFGTYSVVMMGLLIATEVVLSRFASISAWNIKIGFAFIPVAVAAMMLGPVKGGLVGALADFIGAVLFPIGPYFPGFTFTSFLTGMVYGVFLHKNRTFTKVLASVGINQLILSLFLNTLWISVVYGAAYWPLLMTRILQCAVIIPIQIIVLNVLFKTSIGKYPAQSYRG